MIPSYFNSEELFKQLELEAWSWVGTPWAQNSCVKGVAACCHLLPDAILRNCGKVLPFAPPLAPTNWGDHNDESLMEPFLDNAKESFVSVPLSEISPGDIIGFKVGRCVHHLGLMLEGGKFVHAFRKTGVSIATLQDPTYGKRLVRAWRPLP